jgi:ribosome-binding factor A
VSRRPYPRTRRIGAILHALLANEIERLKDPRLGMVSVTAVEVAPDQRRAVVYVSALERDHLEETLAGLRAAAPRLRTLIGNQVRMKFTPALEFEVDPGVIGGEKIENLLRNLNEEERADDE